MNGYTTTSGFTPPPRRPRSRETSTSTTEGTTSSGVWSLTSSLMDRGGIRITSSSTASKTSVWSDDATAMPYGIDIDTGEFDKFGSIDSIKIPEQGLGYGFDDSMIVQDGDGDEFGDRPLIELESNPDYRDRDRDQSDTPRRGIGNRNSMENLSRNRSHESKGQNQVQDDGMTPAERLRALLKEMNTDVQATKSSSSPTPRDIPLPESRTTIRNTQIKNHNSRRIERQKDLLDDQSSTRSDPEISRPAGASGSAWRDRRRADMSNSNSYSKGARSEESIAGPSSPRQTNNLRNSREIENGRGETGRKGDVEGETEDESPPTPPVRFTNPYLYGRKPARSISPIPAQEEVTPQRGTRLPTRAAVLQGSVSKSPPPPSSPQKPKTPLEQYIASQPQRNLSGSGGGSFDRSLGSSGSRKGKERAINSTQRESYSATSDPEDQHSSGLRRSTDKTPRKKNSPNKPKSPVPQNQSSPANRTDRSEQRNRTSKPRLPPTTPRRWSIESAPNNAEEFGKDIQGLEIPGEVELDLDEGMSSRIEGWGGETETETEMETDAESEVGREIQRSPPKRERESRSQRLSRTISDNRAPEQRYLEEADEGARSSSPPLPALPSPEKSDSEDDVSQTYSSRRATLFRSSSKSASTSTSFGTARGFHSPSTSKTTVQGEELPRPASQSPFAPGSSSKREQGYALSDVPSSKRHSSPAKLPVEQSYSNPIDYQDLRETSFLQQSTSRSPQKHSTSTPSPHSSLSINQLSPIRTPARKSPVGNNTISGQTPHPPGWLSVSPGPGPGPLGSGVGGGSGGVKRNVRFSPLRQSDGDWSVSLSQASQVSHVSGDQKDLRNSRSGEALGGVGVGEVDISIHRLRVSPRKNKARESPRKNNAPVPVLGSPGKSAARKDVDGAAADEVEVGNESFTQRLAGLGRSVLGRHPTFSLPRSTTLSSAQSSLATAATRSQEAAEKLEQVQKQWIQALAIAQQSMSNGAEGITSVGSSVVRNGWTWGTWAWWVCLEVVILWGVFRVTLDYAASTYPHDPWSPWSPSNALAISIPPSSSISTFMVPHRHSGLGSANFFDLLESLQVWQRLQEYGVLGSAPPTGWEGVRMMTGVPT